jgi:hypothetical protein
MKPVLLIFAIIFFTTSFGQRTEFNIGAHISALYFTGSGAEKNSFANKDRIYNTGYINDRFGRSPGFGPGLDFMLQRITKSHILFGISLMPEIHKNRIEISSISTNTGTIPSYGKVTSKSHYITLIPNAGYRFKFKKTMTVDVNALLEFAFPITNRTGNGKVRANDGSLTVYGYVVRERPLKDIRPGLMMSVNKNCWSLFSTYSLGQVDNYSNFIGSSDEAYARVYRLGLRYSWISMKKKNK